jgi:hypothetical protein
MSRYADDIVASPRFKVAESASRLMLYNEEVFGHDGLD